MNIDYKVAKAHRRLQRRPVNSILNYDAITNWLYDVRGIVEEVAYATDDYEVLVDTLHGDTDEALEFRAAFSALSADLDRFAEDLDEYGAVPECFDTFFVGIGASNSLDLYSPEIGDYQSINVGFAVREYEREAAKSLSRMTKAQLIDAAGQCLRIAMAYVSLRKRYEDLEDALEALRGENKELLDAIREIERAYEDEGYSEWRWYRLTEALPAECWLR